jgi:hypothetical protein
MTNEVRYPQQPVKTSCLMFFALSGYVSLVLPFAQDRIPVSHWPLVYLYCALLSIAVVGLLRGGIWIFITIQVAGFIAIIPGFVGTWIAIRPGAALGDGMGWLYLSQSLLYAVGICALIFVAKGWLEYVRPSSTRPA